MTDFILLPERGLLKLTGEEKISFLQGLVSNDVEQLESGKAIYAAMLTAQGKFLYDMFLTQKDDAIYLDTWQQTLPELLKKLKMYKLRSKVEIEDISGQFQIAASLDSEQPQEAVFSYPDPRTDKLGSRIIFKTGTQNFAGDINAYEQARIQATVPKAGADLLLEKSFLLDHRFEEINGVDFKKGCYVGQEIVARMKFKAELKKNLFTVKANNGNLPESGSEIFAKDGKKVGELRSQAGDYAIALLNIAAKDNLDGFTIV